MRPSASRTERATLGAQNRKERANPYMFQVLLFPHSLLFVPCGFLFRFVFHGGERSEPEWNTKLSCCFDPMDFQLRGRLIAMLRLTLFFPCQRKKMRPALFSKGASVACASSCNPWTALSQSEAQPELRTPCAPNSNRCQSGGYYRQLV